jgi:hypothetical protein
MTRSALAASLTAALRRHGLPALLLLGGLAIAWGFVGPPPPERLRLAGGPPGSAHAEAIEAYARGLEAAGFAVERRDTAGGEETLALLRQGAVDVALVQGGLAEPARDAGLVSLGQVFREPAWVFVRRGSPVRLRDLGGAPVALGPEGSGSRALGLALLEVNGIGAVRALEAAGLDAAEVLVSGLAEAAVLVEAAPDPAIERLMREATLVDFATRAEAYGLALPWLTPVALPRSGVSLAEDIPDRDMVLMAATAFVAVPALLNPQVVVLLSRIMREVHGGRQLFAAEGSFPSAAAPELPLQPDAARFLEGGMPLLQAWLPFRWAVRVDRFWVLLVPLAMLALALPLFRCIPPLQAWGMKRRIRHWEESLRRIEAEARPGEDPRPLAARLAAMEREVAGVPIRARYGHQLFELRRDLANARDRLTG